MPMRKLLLAVTALVAVLALSPAAMAAKKKTIKTSGTILANTYAPTSNGVTHDAGAVTDKVFGKGALLFDFTVGQDSTVNGTYTVFAPEGTLSGKATYKLGAVTNGSVAFAGTETVTKGTGIYKGAKGSGTVTGSEDASTGFATISYKLKIILPKKK
jgi:hypothetical protein